MLNETVSPTYTITSLGEKALDVTVILKLRKLDEPVVLPGATTFGTATFAATVPVAFAPGTVVFAGTVVLVGAADVDADCDPPPAIVPVRYEGPIPVPLNSTHPTAATTTTVTTITTTRLHLFSIRKIIP